MLHRIFLFKQFLAHSFFSKHRNSSTLKSTRRASLLVRFLLLGFVLFSPLVFAASVSLSASSTSVYQGDSVTLSWNQSGAGYSMGCSLRSNPSGYSASGGGTGSKTFTVTQSSGQVTFSISCNYGGGGGGYGGGYVGGSSGYGSVSNSVTISILNVAPTVSVSVPSKANVGQTVSLTASASDSNGSVSKVEFYVNGGKVGTDTSSPYKVNYPITSSGNKTVYAKATDNDGATKNSPSKVIRANAYPSVSVFAPSSGIVGQTVSLTASASDGDGSISKVEFYVNGSRVKTVTSSPYRYDYPIPSVGTKTIVAIAIDNDGAEKSSSSRNLMGINPSAPSMPSGLSVPSTSSASSFNVSWNASSGTVTAYQLLRNGSLIQSNMNRSRTETLPDDGIYRYKVRACNGSLCSAYTSEVSITINRIIYIHTDLLGTPMIETDGDGNEL